MTYLSGCRWAICALLPLVLYAGSIWSQSPLLSSSQLQALQRQALLALIPAAQPSSIEFDGSFQSEEGSLNQSGSVHLTVGSDGSYSLNSSRTTGPVSESRTVTNGFPACAWTDQDGAVHKSSFINCLIPAWFFPGLALLSPSSDATAPSWVPHSYTSDALGNHLRLQFAVPTSTGEQEDPMLLSPMDLVLDPNTDLPLYAVFTVHPDNPGFDAEIPVKIAYSDYRNVSGVMIPFHIQRFLNGNLILELTITSASVQ